MKQIAAALVEAQKEMGNASKGSENPYFKSKYADLNSVREACIPHLNKHGIVVVQPIVQNDQGKSFVNTTLLHSSGEVISSMVEIIFAKQNDAQAQGSGITYARRYGLQSLVCIGADDDGGNRASLAKAADEDMKAMQQQANQQAFARVKQELEKSESVEGMGEIWKTNLKDINRLKKYANNLFLMLEGTKNQLKSQFAAINELEAPQ